MSSFNGFIFKCFSAIVLLFFLIPSLEIKSQESVLDSTFTFRTGIIKTGNALNLIARQTGYNFTYDSRLIDVEKRTSMDFTDIRLKVILDRILDQDSLVYSVIDRFIIISKKVQEQNSGADTALAPAPRHLTGLVVDEESSEPLPYATIGLKHEGKGTVSNNNGEYGLTVSPESYSDTIVVSYLGYLSREIPVMQSLGNNFRVTLRRDFISIPEIIIRNQIPQEIINKTLRAIPDNYGHTPAAMTAFYREGVLKKNTLQTYSEAILHIFKSPYSGTFLKDQIKVYKSRKIENINSSDSLTVRLKAGLSTCLDLDGARNTFDFLSREYFSDYTYRVSDIVTFDDESAYEIEFAQKESVDQPMFRGSIYINTTDYAILKTDFEINPAYLHKMKDSFVSNPSKGFSTWPVSVKYSISYRKINDRYFLSHVRGDLAFSSKQKKKLFNTQFNVFFEMAVTSVNLENVTRFEREELAPIHSVFSKTINRYDPVFWGNQDFLKPEENLLQAIKDMKVKLHEFTGEDN